MLHNVGKAIGSNAVVGYDKVCLTVISATKCECGADIFREFIGIFITDKETVLPANLASQVESGEVLAALQADVVNTPFVALVSLQTVSQVAIEPFQYDASLKDSFDQASQALKTGDLYGRVMQPLFSNAILRTWLGDLY